MVLQTRSTMLLFRQVLGWLGLALPLVCGGLALLAGNSFIPSISSTHYLNTYIAFEGLMICIGLFLLVYKGYDRMDSILTTLGGIGAIVTALMPCSPSSLGNVDPSLFNRNLLSLNDSVTNIFHNVFVALFFTSISLLVIFQFTKGSSKNSSKLKRNKIYYTCGIIMIVALALLLLSSLFTFEWKPFGKTFIFEWIAVWAFAVAWLVKGEALKVLK